VTSLSPTQSHAARWDDAANPEEDPEVEEVGGAEKGPQKKGGNHGNPRGTGLLALHDGARVVFDSQIRGGKSKRLSEPKTGTTPLASQPPLPIMPSRQEASYFNSKRLHLDPLLETKEEIAQRNADQLFPVWAWELCCGANVLVYGAGGHRELLRDFCLQYLPGEVRTRNIFDWAIDRLN